MDPPGLLSPSTCIKRVFIMVYLLGSTRCSETDDNCACTEIPQYHHTQPEPPGCFQIGSTFRYKCIDGYVRKAGTSNLIRCTSNQKWSNSTLVCKEDPLNAPRTTTERTSTPFPTSPLTPTLVVSSSVSAETELLQSTSTIQPPHLTSGATFETSALPQTSSNTPSSSPVSSSAPVTPEIFHSTPRLSSPTTTQGSRRLDRTTPPVSFINSTSSTQQRTDTVVTKVIPPVAVGIIVVAVIGAIWFLFRRKSRNNPQRNRSEPSSEEERVPMQQIDNMT